MKRSIDIEKLLTWSYREELAKQDFLGPESSMWANIAELGTKVMTGGGSGLQAYAAIIGNGVHPDASAVHFAVCGLGVFQPDWEEPEALLSDMPEEVQALAADAVKGYRVQLDVLVMRCAKMGTTPDWRSDGVPVKKPVLASRSGQPAWFIMVDEPVYSAGKGNQVGVERRERDGYDHVAKRPKPGAYRKFMYEPDPAFLVDRRAEYCCWHAGISMLAESLRGQLSEHDVLPPVSAMMPWEESAHVSGRVLDVPPQGGLEWLKRAARGSLLPPKRIPKAGPVRHILKKASAS